MSEKFAIMLPVIRRASGTWDDQAEQLRGGHKRLTDAQHAVADLGDRVAPAARTYLTTWLTEVTHLTAAAQGRSDGLAEFTVSVVDFDQAAADELRAMLPWDDQDAVRPTVNGIPDFPTSDPGPAPPTPVPEPPS